MDDCVNHPELAAIESCEVCHRPLCALCLWYTADGHRLCENHAQERELAGEAVLAPDTYREALAGSLQRKPTPDEPVAQESTVYHGNSYDLAAALAAVVGVVTLCSCFGGIYCLPIIGFALGLIAFLNANQAIDRNRTRNLAIAGMVGMGFLLVMVVGFILFYVAMFGFIIAAGP